MKFERRRVTLDTGPGLTEQAHKQECDINYILREAVSTGMVRHLAKHQGRYDDVSVQDFQQAMGIVQRTTKMFEALPSKIRKEVGGDPAKFLKFVQDPANKTRLEELGMLKGNDGIKGDGSPSGAPIPDPEPTK